MFDVKNIKRYYRLGLRKIKNFLLSTKSREFLVFLFFVLVSSVFWLLQTLDDVYQTEFKVPIRLKNVPKEVVMTAELPQEVRVQVEDRGTVLLNYMLGRTFLPVTFDFTDYTGAGSHVHIASSELLKRISAQLNVSTRLLSVHPDTIDFIYTKGKALKLPVRLRGEISPGRQYYISHVGFHPDSVIAYAPDEVLDTLEAAYTQEVNFEGVSDTLTTRVKLHGVKGVKFVPDYNDISVCVDMYSEKTVEVPVVGVGFPPGKILRTFPSKVKVLFQVGLRDFKSVTADDFFIGVSYDEIKGIKGDKLTLSVGKAPDCISHVRVQPPSVDYLIEQQAVEAERKDR